MAKSSTVRITVISQKGHCSQGHKVGDQWTIGSETIKAPEGLCLHALHSLYGSIVTLRYGGTFPWEKDTDRASSACPDSGNPCVFEIRRLHE